MNDLEFAETITASPAVVTPDYSKADVRVVEQQHKNKPFAIIPDDHTAQDLSQFMERPSRIKEARSLLTSDSFIAYYNRFKTEASVIFASIHTDSKFTACLDYHGDARTPAWRDHTAHYSCPKSQEWLDWDSFNGRWCDQQQFGEFIEDHIESFEKPEGARILEIAKKVQAKKQVNFTSGRSTQNGDIQFEYREETKASTGGEPGAKGTLEIPEDIELGIVFFEGDAPTSVKAKLRYRIKDAKLHLKIDLKRPDLAMKQAFDEALKKIEQGTGAVIFRS